ncbi:hypothetical protein ACFPA1_23075 [Neobacillus sp. GCM10023253]|uniref:hypothetical protein n=1 Tax=Neobacillus sp. GCM10023253 TaxID=3252644 RepID=UPI003608B424
MYQILVTGHGGFPSSVQSALFYLMGDNPNLSILELPEGMTHAKEVHLYHKLTVLHNGKKVTFF